MQFFLSTAGERRSQKPDLGPRGVLQVGTGQGCVRTSWLLFAKSNLRFSLPVSYVSFIALSGITPNHHAHSRAAHLILCSPHPPLAFFYLDLHWMDEKHPEDALAVTGVCGDGLSRGGHLPLTRDSIPQLICQAKYIVQQPLCLLTISLSPVLSRITCLGIPTRLLRTPAHFHLPSTNTHTQ